MRRTTPPQLPLLLLALTQHISLSHAQSQLCNEISDFASSNATGTYTMPSLSINQTSDASGAAGGLIADTSKTWTLSPRISARSANDDTGFHMWLNTGDSNVTDMGACMAQSVPYNVDEYSFSEDVLLRSQNDNGDCKTFLGEECVAALQDKYKQQAAEAMMRGSCSGGSAQINTTVPAECKDLVGGGEKWLGGIMTADISLNSTYTSTALNESNCDNTTQPLNSSMHALSNMGMPYNQTIRFPSLWFLTFWPNRSDISGIYETRWAEDVHVEIRCLKPGNVQEGSFEPPSAQDLLKVEGVQYAKNLSNSDGSGGSGGDNGSGGLKADAVLGVGIAALVALLLV